MNATDVNVILATGVILAITAVAFLRESADALEALARWAAARAYGLRCAAVELERRRQQEVPND